MILIVTNKNDYTVDYFISKIERFSEDFFRFNTEDFLNNYELTYLDTDSENKWKLRNKINGKIINYNSILVNPAKGLYELVPGEPIFVHCDDKKDFNCYNFCSWGILWHWLRVFCCCAFHPLRDENLFSRERRKPLIPA